MMNNANLIGRLTKAPQLDTTPTGKTVTSFTIAVNRKFKESDGSRKCDFIQVVLWGKPAENFCQWANKGTLVSITGEIRTRTYDSPQNQRVYITEVLAESYDILEKRKENTADRIPAPISQPIDDPFGFPNIEN